MLVKIHGIGSQKVTWHESFDQLLGKELEGLPAKARNLFVNEAVYWADLSVLPGGIGTASLAQPSATSQSAAVDIEYGYVYQSYANYLASGGDPSQASPAAFGFPDPRTVFARLRNGVVSAADQANDVARYVAHNGARAQIHHRLSRKLYELHDTYPNSTLILGSHSQGTIVAYDVLRLAGSRLPRLGTWVTMGCPLAWYVTCARWGSDPLDLPAAMKWLNFYDKGDVVGKTLAPLVSNWLGPQPSDIDVANVGHGLDAHDHWHNPDVVARYAELIREHVSA